MKKIISLIMTLTFVYCTVSFTVYAADGYSYNPKRGELSDLRSDISFKTDIEGELKPYSDNSFEIFNNAMESAGELLRKNADTVSDGEYQECIDNLIFAYEHICVEVHYAKETYVLSLKEDNKNGFYDKDKWNDFTTKRDALRDSFKTNDEYIISDAYFALQDSFIKMTSGYKPGDVNNDGKVNIDDATLVQKYLADMEDLTQVQLALSTSIPSGSCWLEVSAPDIDSVTYLQQCVADLGQISPDYFDYGKTYVDCFDNTFNSLITMDWEFRDDRYEYVDAKVAELEAEGII